MKEIMDRIENDDRNIEERNRVSSEQFFAEEEARGHRNQPTQKVQRRKKPLVEEKKQHNKITNYGSGPYHPVKMPAAAKQRKEKGREPKTKVRKNFQGFSINVCQERKEIGMLVKVPKKYGTLSGFSDTTGLCCSKCYLPPCCLHEWGPQVFWQADQFGGTPSEQIALAREGFTEAFTNALGERYTRKFGMPECANQAIKERYLLFRDESEDEPAEEEESDDDLPLTSLLKGPLKRKAAPARISIESAAGTAERPQKKKKIDWVASMKSFQELLVDSSDDEDFFGTSDASSRNRQKDGCTKVIDQSGDDDESEIREKEFDWSPPGIAESVSPTLRQDLQAAIDFTDSEDDDEEWMQKATMKAKKKRMILATDN